MLPKEAAVLSIAAVQSLAGPRSGRANALRDGDEVEHIIFGRQDHGIISPNYGEQP